MARDASDDVETAIELAADLRREGRIEGSLHAYIRAGALARAAGFESLLAHALRHVSDLARDLGDFEKAFETAEEASRIYTSQAVVPELDLANARRLSALAVQRLGKLGEARQYWQDARELYRRVGVAAGVEDCDRQLTRSDAR